MSTTEEPTRCNIVSGVWSDQVACDKTCPQGPGHYGSSRHTWNLRDMGLTNADAEKVASALTNPQVVKNDDSVHHMKVAP